MRRTEPPEGRSVRLLRVGEQVRHVLSELLARGDVHDDVLQSHLIREVKQFTGLTPKQIRDRPTALAEITVQQRLAMSGLVRPLITST